MKERKEQPGARGNSSQYDLAERLLEYAARVVRLTGKLARTPAGTHVGQQLLRAGTSPLANHAEAQSAESPKDFVHKLRICLKELRESYRWLLLCERVPLVKPSAKLKPLIEETNELIAIFVASIRTAEKRKGTRATR